MRLRSVGIIVTLAHLVNEGHQLGAAISVNLLERELLGHPCRMSSPFHGHLTITGTACIRSAPLSLPAVQLLP
jgi:hypothetical protein